MVKIGLGSELVPLSYSHRLNPIVNKKKGDDLILIMSLNSFPSLSVDGLK